MGVTHDQAVCLRHREWSETSQTVLLFTQRHGIVRGLAKGSRRERAAFSGGFELLQLGEVGLILKPDSDLALLTEWDLLNPHSAIRLDHRAFVLALVAAELTASVLAVHDPHPEIFDGLLTLLDAASGAPAESPHALAVYLASLLRDTGQWPQLTAPTARDADAFAFNPARGRLEADAANSIASSDPFDPGSRHDAVWPIRSQTVRYLDQLEQAGHPAAERATVLRGVRFLTAWLAYRAGRRPHSLKSFLRVTSD